MTTRPAVPYLKKSTIVRIMSGSLSLLFLLAVPVHGQIPDLGLSQLTRGAQAVSPLASTVEMRRWVRRRVSTAAPPELRWRRLARLLVDSPELRLAESPLGTVTAAEAFTTRRANCVAFAHLAVALGREVGLDVYFVLMRDVEGYEDRGTLRIAYGHLAAGFGPPTRRTVLDLGGLSRPSWRRARRIADATALAIFYSNRGAERLLSGEAAAALPWLRAAVKADPELSRAWVNLGVAERRSGDPEAAAAAYRRALEIEPELAPARENLALLKLGR